MNEVSPMIIIAILGSVICVTMIIITHNFWIKRGWSEEWRPAVLGLVFFVSMVITMVPGIIIMDSFYKARTLETISTLDIPEVETTPYRQWNAEFSDDDEHCLALNIYFEARGEEDVRGKYAVADVVMYRFMHVNYPDTVCGVVQEGQYEHYAPVKHKCQFSWWCDGKSDRPVNTTAFNEAIDIAQEVLHDPNYEPRVEYALFYHATSVNPRWAKKMKFVKTIGNHSFYTMKPGHVVP